MQNLQGSYREDLVRQVNQAISQNHRGDDSRQDEMLTEDRVVFVPYNEFVLSKSDSVQLQGFLAALRSVIEQAFRDCPDAPTELPDEDHGELLDVRTEQLVGAACSTCRGWCCRFGAQQNAFIDVPTIQRFRVRSPSATPEEILAAYQQYCVEENYAGSCVYQGSGGCGLPKEMRGSICNRFLCEGVQTLIQLTPQSSAASELRYSCIGAVSGRTVSNIRLTTEIWPDEG